MARRTNLRRACLLIATVLVVRVFEARALQQGAAKQAVVETSAGTFIIDLAPATAPNQTAYFMKLAAEGGSLFRAILAAIVGLAFGVRLKSGFAGGVLLLVLEALIALAFAAMGSWAALRTGSTEAVQSLFPVFFVFLFISSMNIPRNLIETNWFRWAATVNPVSYLIEAVRSLVITGWNGEALGLGFAVSGGLSVLGFALAARALLHRLERS